MKNIAHLFFVLHIHNNKYMMWYVRHVHHSNCSLEPYLCSNCSKAQAWSVFNENNELNQIETH